MRASNKELFVLICALGLNAAVFGSAVYQVYFSNQPHTVVFRVYETNVDYWPEIKNPQTQVLTWGTGKLYFIGTWNQTFIPDHTYNVTYIQKIGAKRPWQYLIVLEWEEIA